LVFHHRGTLTQEPPLSAASLRLIVVASTFPLRRGDGTPGFVWDLAEQEARHFQTVVLVPRIRGAPLRERVGQLEIRRFRYFPGRWEDLADGAILENLRARRGAWLQVLPFLLAEWVELRRLVRRFHPDVLHVHWIVPQGIVASLAAPRTPQVLTTLGGDVYALQGRLAAALKRFVLRRAAAVTVMNEDMRGRLVNLGGDPTTTLVVPMGADVAAVGAAVAGAVRQPGRMLFAGRMVEKKGAIVLIEALRDVGPELGWSLDLVGDGPLRGRLQTAAAGLAGPTRFRGVLDRTALARAMGECEIFVLPSTPAASGDQDGLPVVLLEAMAAGCAIVASRLPGIDEVLTDGQTGLLVPPRDPGALRAALVRLLDDPPLRVRLGAAAAAAVQAYSVQAVGERYAELLAHVAGAATEPSGRAAGGTPHASDTIRPR
jgi:glycosyltransferase involved in cell wall biosynthesis